MCLSFTGLSLAGVLSSSEYPSEPEVTSGEYDHGQEAPLKIIKITRTYAVPIPVPVPFTKEVPVPIPVHKVVPYPIPVPVHKQVLVPHPVAVAVPVHVAGASHHYNVLSNHDVNHGSPSEDQHVQYNQLLHSHASPKHR